MPKSIGSGVVGEEVSIEGKLVKAETYLNHIEVMYSWKVYWDRARNVLLSPFFVGLLLCL